MANTSLHVALPDDLRRYVERHARRAQRTPGEFVCTLIQQHRLGAARRSLAKALLDGLDSGSGIAADERFWADLKHEGTMNGRGRKQPTRRKPRTR